MTSERVGTKSAVETRRVLWLTMLLLLLITVTLSLTIFMAFENNKLRKQVSDIQRVHDDLATKVEDKTVVAFPELNREMSENIENRAFAETAFELAREKIKDEKFDEARLYFLNAINHDPSNIKYVSELVALSKDKFVHDYQVLEQTNAVVELSLFQLAPHSIATAIEYQAELELLQKDIAYADTSAVSPEEVLAKYTELVSAVSLNDISTNVEELEERYTSLEEILNLTDSTDQYQSLRQLITEELESVTGTHKVAEIAETANRYLDLLETEKDYASQAASARFLAASRAMSLFWEYDLSGLPATLATMVNTEIPSRITASQAKIQEAKSLPVYTEAIAKIQETLSDESGLNQEKIERYVATIESVVALLPDIIYSVHLSHLQGNLKILNDRIVAFKRQQYVDYQVWASEVIEETTKTAKNEIHFSSDDAKRIFSQYKLASIDLRLLSPEASPIYQKILQKIIGKLSGPDAFQIHRRTITADKKRLENF